jgi:hypothetical protein
MLNANMPWDAVAGLSRAASLEVPKLETFLVSRGKPRLCDKKSNSRYRDMATAEWLTPVLGLGCHMVVVYSW